MCPTHHRLITGVAALSCVGLIAAGCGSTTGSGASASTPAPAPTSAPATTPPAPSPTALTLNSPADASQTHDSTVQFSGTSTPGAIVTVDNAPAGRNTTKVNHGGSWNIPTHLANGDNSLTVTAVKAGLPDAPPTTLTVTRTLTQAEQAAQDAAAAASFKASTTTVSYADLLKDSGPFVGKAVSFRGQVFQIQQSGSNGGIILLAVTDDGTGFWTDHVWVDYDHSTAANTNSIITVYGTVTGTKSYDTQNGGSTYVPQMHARYIDLTG